MKRDEIERAYARFRDAYKAIEMAGDIPSAVIDQMPADVLFTLIQNNIRLRYADEKGNLTHDRASVRPTGKTVAGGDV